MPQKFDVIRDVRVRLANHIHAFHRRRSEEIAAAAKMRGVSLCVFLAMFVHRLDCVDIPTQEHESKENVLQKHSRGESPVFDVQVTRDNECARKRKYTEHARIVDFERSHGERNEDELPALC